MVPLFYICYLPKNYIAYNDMFIESWQPSVVINEALKWEVEENFDFKYVL